MIKQTETGMKKPIGEMLGKIQCEDYEPVIYAWQGLSVLLA